MIPMQSESIKEITKAMIKANEAAGVCEKDSDGHKYKYAKLPALLKAVLPGLRENGLMLKNIPQIIDGTFVLVCQITHGESGEYIRGVYPLDRDSNSAMSMLQQNGSAITYAARYSIANMLSLPVANEEDNDGATNDANPKVVWAMIYKEKDEEKRKTLINNLANRANGARINDFNQEQCDMAIELLEGYFNK